MKKMRVLKKILLLVAVSVFCSTARADSPLTSTDFYTAYTDAAIVRAAAHSNGALNDELMNYLVDPKNPIDVKMAVINRLGWKIEGKNNARIFMDFAMKKYKYQSEKKFLKKAKADVLLATAYLKALDNYFDVREAAAIAERALKKNRASRTFNLIAALIKAQNAMEGSWCAVYQATDQVRRDSSLTTDIKPAAVAVIYEYMDGYGEYCRQPAPTK